MKKGTSARSSSIDNGDGLETALTPDGVYHPPSNPKDNDVDILVHDNVKLP